MHLTRLLLVSAVSAVIATAAAAGPQYVDATGYANSGYDVVAYFDLEQVPPGRPQPPAVPGRASFTAEYNGAKFAFASAENRERFLANPEKYVPAYDGHCAYGVAVRNKVPANPHLWRIVDGVLYLNITADVARTWEKDIPGYIEDAERLWPRLESLPAAGWPVPEFTPEAPVKG